MEDQIGKLVQNTKTYTADIRGKFVDEYFTENPDAEAVIVLDGNYPCGIISRNDFYQKIGSTYGHSLYMNRPIEGLMNTEPLVVEATVDTSEVALLAMGRDLASMYEPVVVVENNLYTGIVSIKLFMHQFSEQREKEISLLTSHRYEIEAKNKQLELRNSAVKNLLDNTGQGFLSFGPDLIIDEEYSRECDRIFGTCISGMLYLGLVSKFMGIELEQDVRQVLERIFLVATPSKSRVYLSMLPEEHLVRGRNIRFDYRLILDSSGHKVMAILTDITEKKQLERQMEQERNNVKLILQALENQDDLKILIDDLKDLIHIHMPQMISQPDQFIKALEDAYRYFHTYKGEFSQYSMHHTAAALHDVEEHLSAWLNGSTDFDMDKAAEYIRGLDAEKMLEEDMETIRQTLGDQFFLRQQTIAVQKRILLELESDMKQCLPPDTAGLFLPRIKKMQCHSLKQILLHYDGYVQTLAEKLGKSIAPLQVTGTEVYILKYDYQAFLRSLIHLFRNMADHGIEKTNERTRTGKPQQGKISIDLKAVDNVRIQIIIQDDGQGIAPEKIRQRVAEMGLLNEEKANLLKNEELINMVFMQGFSLQKNVTMVSGRGAGLSAVKKEVERLNGTILIQSVPGAGTTYYIDLPMSSNTVVAP